MEWFPYCFGAVIGHSYCLWIPDGRKLSIGLDHFPACDTRGPLYVGV